MNYEPAGTIESAIPKLRKGSYFPDWLVDSAMLDREGA
jgi:transposase-like protein